MNNINITSFTPARQAVPRQSFKKIFNPIQHYKESDPNTRFNYKLGLGGLAVITLGLTFFPKFMDHIRTPQERPVLNEIHPVAEKVLKALKIR